MNLDERIKMAKTVAHDLEQKLNRARAELRSLKDEKFARITLEEFGPQSNALEKFPIKPAQWRRLRKACVCKQCRKASLACAPVVIAWAKMVNGKILSTRCGRSAP